MKSSRGPPAITVQVEIDPTRLKEEIGDFGGVKEVVAEIPSPSQGWRAEHLRKEGPVARDSAEPLERYSTTLYGPSDSHERGIAVTIDTDAGTVAAQQRGEAHSVSESGKPDESHTIPSPTRKRARARIGRSPPRSGKPGSR